MLSFESLSPKHKPVLSKIGREFKPYSDFNFASLYSWNIGDKTKIAIGESAVCIVMPDYISGQLVATILGDSGYKECLNTCISWFKKESCPLVFKFLPEESSEYLIKALDEQGVGYRLAKDRDQYDYMLDINEITGMKGKKFADFRYKLKQFDRTQPGLVHRAKFNLEKSKDRKAVMELAETWSRQKSSPQAVSHDELVALDRYLGLACSDGSMRFIAYEAAGRLVGFASAELLDEAYALGHFLKYDPSIKNMYQKLVYDMCLLLRTEGVSLLNIEQDLGIAGLRQAKMGLRPSAFLKKYRIEVTHGR